MADNNGIEFIDLLSKINGDPQKAAAIIFDLNLSGDDLADRGHSNKVFDVINRLMKVDDYQYFINKLTINKPGTDKIGHMWTYFNVLEQKDFAEKKLNDLSSKIQEMDSKIQSGMTSETDILFAGALVKNKQDLENKVSSLTEELSFF